MFLNKRMICIFFLGMASGLPLALTGSTLQAWFTTADIDLATIGMLALLGQPYTLKFLWAPLFDRFLPPMLDRRRGWIACLQIMLALSLVLITFTSPKHYLAYMLFAALGIAFFSASLDICIDAYRTDLLTPQERGPGAAMTVGGFRVGMLLSGGLALIVADYFGWQACYILMAIIMLSTVFITLLAPTIQAVSQPRSLNEAITQPFLEFFQRKHALWLLVFIFLYKMGEAFTSSSGPMTNAFLLRGIGFSLTDVGLVNKGIGFTATLLGVFLGGSMLARSSLYRCLMRFGWLQALSNLLFLALAVYGKSMSLFISAVFIDNFCGGMGTAALVSLLMSLCDKRYSATQFALLSSVMALSRIIVGAFAGFLVEQIGWVEFFIWSFILALPCLLVLYQLKPHFRYREAKPGFAI